MEVAEGGLDSDDVHGEDMNEADDEEVQEVDGEQTEAGAGDSQRQAYDGDDMDFECETHLATFDTASPNNVLPSRPTIQLISDETLAAANAANEKSNKKGGGRSSVGGGNKKRGGGGKK